MGYEDVRGKESYKTNPDVQKAHGLVWWGRSPVHGQHADVAQMARERRAGRECGFDSHRPQISRI